MKGALPLLVLVLLVGSAHLAKTRWFSVQVRGTLLCHEKAHASQPIDIFHESKQLDYTNFLAHYTDKHGFFDLTAKLQTEEFMINPYLVIRHRCWESLEVPHKCNRKIVWGIPPGNLTNAEEPTKLFEIGTIDLRYKHKNEVKVKCGIA